MELNQRLSLSLTSTVFLFLLMFSFSASASSFISGYVFEAQGSTGRTLLQAKKPCPVNFEFLNYTIITSQCKGPQYTAKLCCGAFKEFACPYADNINDLTNDCAGTMFSYINLYGKYPPGLFSSLCQDDKRGLECPALSLAQAADPSGHEMTHFPSLLLILTTGLLVLQIHLS